MRIDVQELLARGEEQYNFQEVFADFKIGQEEIFFNSPVSLEVNAQVMGKEILIRGKISTKIKFLCNRCLQPYEKIIVENFFERFVKESVIKDKKIKNEDDLHIYNGNFINLNEYVFQDIVLSIPVKRICSEDCRGLCPKCGANLNEEKCECGNASEIDVRLVKLKDYFKKR